MLKDFIHVFTLSCKQATFLIEKRLHLPLSFTERVRLRVHFSLCRLCCVYQIQAILLHGWLRKKTKEEIKEHLFDAKEVKLFQKNVKEKLIR
ncbi:MAG: hypothetical protein RR711_01175 [Bacteroides sp.]|uniref:hypothetical protein n=1 Tax=Bacteroides sp. TaxID=29523 RepID=UPI002AB1D1CC|nr:hypothetical protein [Bacteroides sp.]